ncbi:MAG: bifunctional adenosylcobinamide kinase/adenosylcobinamide-phosphate guanylyltransferase, partial [Deltaproteobacteria bacterium]
MTKNIIMITGGARSGKSRYAEERAAALGARPLYIATAEA